MSQLKDAMLTTVEQIDPWLRRADMDALPIREGSGLPYASASTQEDLIGTVQPVMHAW
ncbi:hypothetical protein [Brachybacterium sp. p3-SID957]|uniref:hypothetical protein n=1 Tax=Brachybacterium sp. p3-SID957 TaxID=2916049 RepID=UPI00223B463B|nr:hypothetical protein [Brachybacterium sp. p3-SID957]MCT1774528.1 hypothetical protein [Brachybacterium sp. p3-SID957]